MFIVSINLPVLYKRVAVASFNMVALVRDGNASQPLRRTDVAPDVDLGNQDALQKLFVSRHSVIKPIATHLLQETGIVENKNFLKIFKEFLLTLEGLFGQPSGSTGKSSRNQIGVSPSSGSITQDDFKLNGDITLGKITLAPELKRFFDASLDLEQASQSRDCMTLDTWKSEARAFIKALRPVIDVLNKVYNDQSLVKDESHVSNDDLVLKMTRELKKNPPNSNKIKRIFQEHYGTLERSMGKERGLYLLKHPILHVIFFIILMSITANISSEKGDNDDRDAGSWVAAGTALLSFGYVLFLMVMVSCCKRDNWRHQQFWHPLREAPSREGDGPGSARTNSIV